MRIDLSIFNDEKEKFLYDVEEDDEHKYGDDDRETQSSFSDDGS